MVFQLETKRLILKPMVSADAKGLFDLNSDPDVVRYSGDALFSNIDEADRFISSYNDFEKYGCARLSTFIKETGEYIGWCGLRYLTKKNKTDIGTVSSKILGNRLCYRGSKNLYR